MQANDANRWAGRPALARIVRALAYVIPVAASVAAALALTTLTPRPGAMTAAVLRWLTIAVLSSIVLVQVERLARRLLPIAALLELTLIFPDRAPSRFRVALRTGSTRQLERRLAETHRRSRHETPSEAAERIVELVGGLRAHDRVTRGHAERVRAYTQLIADEMGLPDAERERLRWAGLLHDIGKLRVPGEILNKSGRLTDEEFDIIKQHPEHGRQIIEPLIPWLGEAARAVWEHHERWDGGGYPRGLAGDEISLSARIVSVADVYDVLTSVRSYKSACSPAEARAELTRCAGTQFDPGVVRAFLRLSLGDVRAAGGPVSWLAQLTLFPSALVTSARSLVAAAIVTGGLAASVAGATSPSVQVAAAPRLVGLEEFRPWSSGGGQLPDADGVVSAEPDPTGEPDAASKAPTAPIDDLVGPSTRPPGPITDGVTSVPPTPTTTAVPTTTSPRTVTTGEVTSSGPTGVTVPGVSVPELTVPVLTVPELTVPVLTLPGLTVPVLTLPGLTVPVLTVPELTVPELTVPTVTVPTVTVPTVTVPTVTVPTVTVPTVTTTLAPPITVPTVTTPLPVSTTLPLP